MKSAQQKLRDEVGIFLRAVRKRQGLKKDDVARRLGYTGGNFVTRIEGGKAVVPIGKIGAFSEAYGLPVAPFGRLILNTMHPEVNETLLMLLKHDEDLVKTAAGCHGVKEETRFERMQVMNTKLRQGPLHEMRRFFADNPDFVPEGFWDKRDSAMLEAKDVE